MPISSPWGKERKDLKGWSQLQRKGSQSVGLSRLLRPARNYRFSDSALSFHRGNTNSRMGDQTGGSGKGMRA